MGRLSLTVTDIDDIPDLDLRDSLKRLSQGSQCVPEAVPDLLPRNLLTVPLHKSLGVQQFSRSAYV